MSPLVGSSAVMVPLFAAAAGDNGGSLVSDIGFCLIVAGILSLVFARFKIPSIAAFLVAGVIVGPQLGHLVTNQANIETIAHLGLALLLFVIGLEINVGALLRSGRTIVLSGLLQFPLTVAFGWAAAALLRMTGWAPASGTYLPIYVGFTLASSSTLLVVKIMQEKFQMDTVTGRVAVGLLIAQDVWSIVVLALQPNFSRPELGVVGLTFLGIAVVAGVAVLLAHYALPVAFRWIAKSPELMLVAAAGWCFAIGTFGSHLGSILALVGLKVPMQVSMEMGALIAGTSIASLPYTRHVVAKVAVVKDFFITLFFVALGMGIPRPEGANVLLLALVLSLLVLLSRWVVFFPLFYFTGLDRRGAFVGATRLAQISEFCLVIGYLGIGYGHITSATSSAIIFAFVTMALATPFLYEQADRVHDWLGPTLQRLGFRAPEADRDATGGGEAPAIVLLGFHRVASSLLWEMQKRDGKLLAQVLVVDFNVALHRAIAATGARVTYGDISNFEMLQELGVDRARVIVSTVPDDVLKGTTNLRLAEGLRQINPEARLIVNAVDFASVRAMYAAGADYVYLSRVETARNVLPVVEAALAGPLVDFRRSEDAARGAPDARAEVLP
ncbi:MAG TPA: cation:proton antiporter [Thermoanaerobaculaceae bacterium]|nr:cation:proton antiporter [Thermoanaerobaculaceae bacterium]